MKELTQFPMSSGVVMNQNLAIDTPLSFDITRFVEDFLKSLDLKVTSKVTYKRAIRPFLTWIQETELQQAPTREDILLYKTTPGELTFICSDHISLHRRGKTLF